MGTSWGGWFLVEIFKVMLGWDSENEIWSRFVFKLVIWTQPSGPLCLWQCFYLWSGPLSRNDWLHFRKCGQKGWKNGRKRMVFKFIPQTQLERTANFASRPSTTVQSGASDHLQERSNKIIPNYSDKDVCSILYYWPLIFFWKMNVSLITYCGL